MKHQDIEYGRKNAVIKAKAKTLMCDVGLKL